MWAPRMLLHPRPRSTRQAALAAHNGYRELGWHRPHGCAGGRCVARHTTATGYGRGRADRLRRNQLPTDVRSPRPRHPCAWQPLGLPTRRVLYTSDATATLQLHTASAALAQRIARRGRGARALRQRCDGAARPSWHGQDHDAGRGYQRDAVA